MDIDNLLDGYFEGSLTPEEQAYLEILLQNNQELVQELALRKKLQAAIHLSERATIKRIFKNATTKPNRAKLLFLRLSVAAAILCFLIAGWFFINQQSNNKSWYAAYYETYPNIIAPVTRSENFGVDSIEEKAFKAYDNKLFAEAYLYFETILNTRQKEYALFYMACCAMEQNEEAKALSLFLSKSWEKSIFIHDVWWYKSLCLLKLNRISEALVLLKELINLKTVYATKASELSELLK
jgi:hypothetical protein